MTQLTDLAVAFLRRLDRKGRLCYLNVPPREPCLELVQRGYCKLEPDYCREPGQPCIPTGSVVLSLTDAGRHVLELLPETVAADEPPPHLDARA